MNWKAIIVGLFFGILIHPILVILLQSSPTALIVGEQHLSPMQQEYFDFALSKGCKNGRIITLSTILHPTLVGRTYPPVYIIIYSVDSLTPIELYCVMRHECNHGPTGVHDWNYVWNECYQEAIS